MKQDTNKIRVRKQICRFQPARSELNRVLALKKQENTAEKQLYSRMMGGVREPQPASQWQQIVDQIFVPLFNFLAENYRVTATAFLVIFIAWSLLKLF